MRKFEKLYESIKKGIIEQPSYVLLEDMPEHIVHNYLDEVDKVFDKYESEKQDPIIVLDRKFNKNNNTYEVVYTIGSKKNNVTHMDKFDKELLILKLKNLLRDLEDINSKYVKVIPKTLRLKKRGINGLYPAFRIEIGD